MTARRKKYNRLSLARVRFKIFYPSDPCDEGPRKHHKSSFLRSGKFPTTEALSLDVDYQVQPTMEWDGLSVYEGVELNDVEYLPGSFIWVANETASERRKAVMSDGTSSEVRSKEPWVARIEQIRAIDEEDIYLLVCWMYWPDELPSGTQYGEVTVQGRQSYHGWDELIASNGLDIISVESVIGPAPVQPWVGELIDKSLHWRQVFNCQTMALSSLDLVCSCRTPEKPDALLLGCDTCQAWLHQQCIIDATLEGITAERKLELGGASHKPWEGLFEAEIKLASSPTVIHIKDLREGIAGATILTKRIKCLVCKSTIN